MNQAKTASMRFELELAQERKYAMPESVPCVVIVRGGFGGLAAAKALRKAAARIILIDRTNHHLFQPLLYQVATSVLAPGQISYPIREILRRQNNTTVIMGEVTGVDKDQRCVFANSPDREQVPVKYDYLILATGGRHSYFGHDVKKFAPRLGGGASRVPRATGSADKRVCAMDLDFCDRATRLPIDCGSHRARAGEVNTSDCSFNCTRISARCPAMVSSK
jgi:pyridine nucleotide-disulfide oxidoreductase